MTSSVASDLAAPNLVGRMLSLTQPSSLNISNHFTFLRRLGQIFSRLRNLKSLWLAVSKSCPTYYMILLERHL